MDFVAKNNARRIPFTLQKNQIKLQKNRNTPKGNVPANTLI